MYSLISLVGIVLVVKGYAEFRQSAPIFYVAPMWLRHVAAALLLPTFVLLLAPYFPGRIKNAVKQPQLIAVKTWAIGHLLVNGSAADLLLFGAFLIWAVADVISMKRRSARPVPGAPESRANDFIVVVLGFGLYVATIIWLHEALIGVRPLAV